MLRLLTDENIPRRLVALLKRYGVDVIRLQDLNMRGVSDQELARIASQLGRTILTRDSDFTTPHLLSLAQHGVVYISCQPSKDELPRLAKRIATIARQLEPKPRLLVIVERGYMEVYY